MYCSTVMANNKAPSGHIKQKIKFTINCRDEDQPLADISEVIDRASSGLCSRIARKTLRPPIEYPIGELD